MCYLQGYCRSRSPFRGHVVVYVVESVHGDTEKNKGIGQPQPKKRRPDSTKLDKTRDYRHASVVT